jgi:hypothetical protein
MFNTIVGARAVEAGARAASRYGSGSDQKMRLQLRLRNTVKNYYAKLHPSYFKGIQKKRDVFILNTSNLYHFTYFCQLLFRQKKKEIRTKICYHFYLELLM